MGSHDMAPLPTRLLKKAQNADALIVEADVSTSDTPFANLPACEARKSALARTNSKTCSTLARDGHFSVALSTQPLWQIAMVLQATQAQNWGCGQNTVSITSYCRRLSNNINP